MYTIINIYAWKLLILFSICFCGGYVFGLRHSKFKLEDDEDEEE